MGLGEALIIGFVLLVVFSTSRMSKLGNALGKFVYSFRRAANGQDLVDVTHRRMGSGAQRGETVDGKPTPGSKK